MTEPRRPTAPQLWRMQKIVAWLRTGRRFTATAAAGEFQVSRRTVMSDIEHLRFLGVPLEYDPDKRSYVLTEAFAELPAPQINASEWTAMVLAERVLEAIGAEPHAKAVQKVIARIQEHLPLLDGSQPSLFQASLSFLPEHGETRPIPWLADVERAVRDQLAVRMTYFTQYRSIETDRTVEPYHVLVRGGRGYLIARCRTREDVLIFRMDRIRRLAVQDEVFLLPDDWSLEAFLGPMFGVFNDREVHRVKIRFSPWVARWIKEEVWHPSQILTDLPDGSLQLDMDVTGLEEVRRWVLGFGRDAEAIEPERLVADVARERGGAA